MPFTPLHMGAGISGKAVLQGNFSLMVFGWSQIVMDLQPLVVMLTHEGEMHGVSHTFVGAAALGVISAVTGKYLTEWTLNFLSFGRRPQVVIRWWVAFLSALLGTFSHVLLDALIYSDMKPFFPFSYVNPLLSFGVTSYKLAMFCIYSGVAGMVLYTAIRIICLMKKRHLVR